MTAEEAIKIIRGAWSLMCQTNIRFDFITDYREAAEIAVKALNEVQKYREIGTVEECREAVEKQKGMQISGMRDDLISRKALLKQFTFSDSGRRIPEYDIDNFPITISVKDVKDIIRKSPTAFDKEKVIDELKSAENYLYVNGIRITNFKFIHPLTAIEIVEKGGLE